MSQNVWRSVFTFGFLMGALAALLPAFASRPIMLRPAEYVEANGSVLDAGTHAIPCVADWNNDGLKDLILGYKNADKVALYINQGTQYEPAFGGFANLQADGSDIYHSSSGCGAPAPWVCDYDDDGKKDLLVGTGAEGYVYFYRNTNTDAEPVLDAGVQLTVGLATLDVGARATPYVHDWDEDGLDDLLCGDGDGNAHFFENVGTADAPAYLNDVLIEAGGSTVDFGSRSAIRVCDWDGDGVKDLLGSASYNASWCRNIGTDAAPVLESPEALQSPVQGTGLADIDTGYRMRLEVVDWNGDAVTDLLIGDDEGYVFYFEGYDFALTAISVQEGDQVALQWKSSDYLEYNILAGESPDALAVVATSLASGGKTTSWAEITPQPMRFYRVQVTP